VVGNLYQVYALQYGDQTRKKQTPWPESTSELYWQSDRRLSGMLVAIFADTGLSRSQCDGTLLP
jgi:hypothetical protein